MGQGQTSVELLIVPQVVKEKSTAFHLFFVLSVSQLTCPILTLDLFEISCAFCLFPSCWVSGPIRIRCSQRVCITSLNLVSGDLLHLDTCVCYSSCLLRCYCTYFILSLTLFQKTDLTYYQNFYLPQHENIHENVKNSCRLFLLDFFLRPM